MKKILLLTILLAAGMPSLALSDDDDPHPWDAKQEKKYKERKPEIEALDENGDGILQPEEIKAGVSSKFESMDANGDGTISAKERASAISTFQEKKEEKLGALAKRRASRLEERMENADINKDGKISAEEYQEFYGGRYDSMDKDGDGNLDIKEYRTDTEKSRKRSAHD